MGGITKLRKEDKHLWTIGFLIVVVMTITMVIVAEVHIRDVRNVRIIASKFSGNL